MLKLNPVNQTVYYSVFLACFLLSNSLFAQNKYVIIGKVTDAQTGEGIPFATVALKGKPVGTQSDFEGNYRLSAKELTDSLLISSMGYAVKSKPLTNDSLQTINAQLLATSKQLKEVVVRARGQDPAYRIMRRVDERRNQNDFAQLKAYQWEAYNRISISVQNLSEKFKQKKIIRDIYDKITQIEALRDKNANVVIPIYSSESISTVYSRKDPTRMKEIVQKNYAKGLGITDDDFVAQLTASGYNTINFYQNWVGLFRKEFMSPLAKGGTGFYTYFLRDTTQVGLHPCYRIDFDPKNPRDLAFRGTVWIDTTTYALVQIDATIDKSANINFIDKIQIQQEYEKLGEKEDTWVPEKTRMVIDASELFDKSTGVVVGLTISVKDVVANQPKSVEFFDTPVELTEDSKETNEAFWQSRRQEKMTPDEQLSFALIDTVSQVPSFKRLARTVDFFINGGYLHLAPGLDYGSTFFSYAYNNVEHNRLWTGLRTNAGFNKKWALSGYLAYGTRDRKFKYGLDVTFVPTRAPMTRLGVKMNFDLDQIGIRQADIGDNPLFQLASRFGRMHGAYYQRDFQTFFQRDFFQSLTSTLTLRYRQFYPLYYFFNDVFAKDRFSILSPFDAPEASVSFRYVPNRLPTRNPNRIRSRAGRTAPIIGFNYTVGHINDTTVFGQIEKNLGNYHIIKADFSHVLRFGLLGRTEYTIEGLYTPSLLPTNLLNVHLGNETFVYAKNAFNLMSFAEFASDKYVSLSFHHSFEGLLTNRIPLLNKWKLRTFAVGKVLLGSLRQDNEQLLAKYFVDGNSDLPLSQLYIPKSLSSVPYVEVGYGVDNIFRFLRVVAFHRLTYLNAPGVRSFGVRAAVHIAL